MPSYRVWPNQSAEGESTHPVQSMREAAAFLWPAGDFVVIDAESSADAVQTYIDTYEA